MADFDVSLDDAAVQEALDDIQSDTRSQRVEVVGTTVEYGVFLEFGTEDMPPYRWFRPAVREFEANPTQFIRENTAFASIEAIPDADTLVTAVAQALVNQMENNVSAVSSADRSPGTHPDHPKVDTGNLKSSIQAIRVSG